MELDLPSNNHVIRATTGGITRKDEYHSSSEIGMEILSRIPSELLQGNEDKVTIVSSDGPIKGVYFNSVIDFDDLVYEHDNVRLVSLKYNEDTKEHYYKYYVLYNPLDVQMDNIVSTGFFSNNPTKLTVYIVSELHGDEFEDFGFVNKDFKGITIDIATGDTIMETDYEPTSPEGSQG